MKNSINIIFISCIVLMMIIGLVLAEDIRPANQREDKGIGVQIRPANQMNQPSKSNGAYSPSQGSNYKSGYKNKKNLAFKSVLNYSNEVNSSSIKNNLTVSEAKGVATFVLNTVDNTLTYNVSIEGLSSNETSAHIHGPATTEENSGILFPLPLGNIKFGVWNYNEFVEDFIFQDKTYINIHSLFFPNGEIRGQIVEII